MYKKLSLWAALTGLIALGGIAFAGKAVAVERPLPRLILQITVDQLRGDLPRRYRERFGQGGFRLLMNRGTDYLDARHRHANTETIVGHTTLATGADPSAHGMVANVWFDRSTGALTYNVEDERYPLLTSGAGIDKQTEIDPSLRAARTDGRSPSGILVSTFADELMLRFGRRSKVFSVSVKDRGAIPPAGHSGKAFWFSKATAGFVTSRFYYENYPDWVAAWNAKKLPEAYAGKSWTLLHDRSTYMFGDADDRPYEAELPGFGRVFPHPYGAVDDRFFTTLLTVSPAGDELTLDFAKTLIDAEGLGQDDIPDYLAVSFSSVDYVGHLFGPSSLESEDMMLRLDRILADLISFVEKRVGLNRTLVVLSADHGGPEAPGYLSELGFEADYIRPKEFDRSAAIAALKARFGIGEPLINTYYHPYLYLNREEIDKAGLDLADVSRAVAHEIMAFDGVALAIPSSDLASGRFPDTPVIDAILKNYNPRRSGDIYIVFEPNRFINDFDGLSVAVTHGSPWRYDSHVPIMIAGMGIQSRRVSRPVNTIAVAPTLSMLVGAKPPSGAFGEVLHEVIGN